MGSTSLDAHTRAGPLDRGQLDEIVVACFPGSTVVSVEPLLGGLSSALDVLTLDGAPHDRVVLRRLPTEWGDGPTEYANERRAHALAAAAGLAVPDVLWADDGALLGRPALLLPFAPGRPVVPELPDQRASAAFAAAVRAVGDVTRPPGDARLPVLDGLAAHLALFGGHSRRSEVVDAEGLLRAVEARGAVAGPPTDLLHGDLHGGNVLWDGAKVTAILDWPGAAWGVRWYDEAYAVLDTLLAHGEEAADELLTALRGRPEAAAPGDDVWALWTGAALVRALPSPLGWLDAYLDAGCEVDADTLGARYVMAVTRWLDQHG